MSGGVYLLRGEDDMVEMTETPYDSEAVLQALLAKYPSLLAGDQVSATERRRWLLIRREAGIASERDGADRWAIDHLFLDQDAVPTLVEVKRSSDSRIRRAAVGQMLDYAANAVVHWPVEALQAAFERRCEVEGLDPEAELKAVVPSDADTLEFWKRVDVNLQAGRVRLVFVADEIPQGLHVSWGRGKVDGSFIPVVAADGREHYPIAVYSYGRVEIQFQHLNRAPFDDLEMRGRFLHRLNDVPGVSIPETSITKRPSIGLGAIGSDPAVREGFIAALDWFRAAART